MPQTARLRPDDKERTARAQEQEFKRARGAISCAECRRLKLKCDKTVPCSSCKRRGCSSICPNGSLTTGQGTRFILADTDRLHRKIAEMSDRIRQLEDALAILQSSVTRESHPLLSSDLLKIKSGLELHSAIHRLGDVDGEGEGEGEQEGQHEAETEESQYIDAFGTLAVRDDGGATFYGRSAGSESLLLNEDPPSPALVPHRPSSPRSRLPHIITRFTTAFPSAPSEVPPEQLMDMVADFLPPWPRAARLCDLYLEQAPWFFGAVTRRQLVEEVLPLFYDEAVAYRDAEAGRPDPNALTSSAAAFNLAAPSPARADAPSQSSHDLALLLVVFCFGALTDADLLPAPHNTEADRYFRLARAALNAEPVLERPPSVATVQTLSLMGIYHGLVADEHSIESTWALMGLSSKLAQSVGLHRDCARWKLSPAEVQKRRALFWELFITDCWQALATGRLPTFSMPFVDTELPGDPDQTIAEDGSVQPSFPSWKARWGRECLAEVVQGTLTSRAPKYTVILELDRKLRDMPLPQYALGAPPKGTGLSQTMSHFMPINYLHLTLLYVHRCFFAQALADHPTDPLRSQYAPSFLAGYRSACALLSTVREQFTLFPVQIARFWVLWTHAFSSSVMLASVVTHGRTTKTAQAALGELRLACDLFEKAAEHGGRAVKFLPIVRRLHDKAYRAHTQGQPPRRDIFTPRVADDAQDDELSIFSGRTRTVATKSNKPPRPRSISRRRAAPGPGPAAPTPPDSQSGAGVGPLETFPSLESYGSSVHPVLADEMRAFQGALDAQISSINAYYLGAQQAAQYPPQPQYDAWYAMQEQDALAPAPAAMHFQQASELVPVPIPVQHAGEHLPQMPVYGAMDPGTVSEPQYYNYGVPVPPQGAADHGYQTHPPAHSELWQVPPGGGEAVFPGTSPEYRHLAGPAYQHAESGSRSESQSRRESFTQSQQHQMMPPPAVLPVRPGAYSLQETWTSFMQQELPTPVSQHPGFGRR